MHALKRLGVGLSAILAFKLAVMRLSTRVVATHMGNNKRDKETKTSPSFPFFTAESRQEDICHFQPSLDKGHHSSWRIPTKDRGAQHSLSQSLIDSVIMSYNNC